MIRDRQQSDLRVRTKNVSARFGKLMALDNISISIKRGQIVGIVGAPGAGKSLFLKILAGVENAFTGEVCIQPNVASIGYMAADLHFVGSATVLDFLTAKGLEVGLHGERLAEAIHWSTDFFGLGVCLDRECSRLSPSWQRRITFAGAAIHRPQLLLLDELTILVEPRSAVELLNLVADLAQQGVAVIYTVYVMEEAELCDIICYLFRGKLIYCGCPNTRLFSKDHQLNGKRWLSFTCNHPTLAAGLLKDAKLSCDVSIDGHTLHILAPMRDSIDLILNLLAEAKINIGPIVECEPPLEAFLRAFDHGPDLALRTDHPTHS